MFSFVDLVPYSSLPCESRLMFEAPSDWRGRVFPPRFERAARSRQGAPPAPPPPPAPDRPLTGRRRPRRRRRRWWEEKEKGGVSGHLSGGAPILDRRPEHGQSLLPPEEGRRNFLHLKINASSLVRRPTHSSITGINFVKIVPGRQKRAGASGAAGTALAQKFELPWVRSPKEERGLGPQNSDGGRSAL